MICSIMFAYLRQINRRDRFRDVLIGVFAAIILSIGVGIAIFLTIHDYAGTALQTKIESFTYLIAALILTYMTFWMKKQSRFLKRDIEQKMSAAFQHGMMWSISLVAFITVGREGIETVVFMIAIAFQTKPILLISGATLGLFAGLSLSYLIYVAGRRINMRHFFTTMGTLLMLFGAGLLSNAVEDWQQLGWIPLGVHPLWNTSSWINENSTFGDILHSFFGYAANPSALQVAIYLVYLAVMVYAYLRKGSSKSKLTVTPS